MFRAFIGKEYQRLNFFFYLLTFLTCFLFYSHTDALYTDAQSILFFRHFHDFYSFNNQHLGLAPYLPSLYGVIALWNLPLEWLGLIDPSKIYQWALDYPVINISHSEFFIFIAWYKVLICIMTVLSGFYLNKIAFQIGIKKPNSALLFFTSPFTIFFALIFSGYDIFSIFFTLVGIFYLFRNEKIKFSLFFSLAITFKFFPALLYLPLLLITEKKITNIFKFGIIALSSTSLLILIFHYDPYFFKNILFLAKEKTSFGSLSIKNALFIFSYCAICFYSYRFNNSKMFHKTVLLISYITYSSLFLFVKINPQWVFLLIPFSVLLLSFFKDQRKYIVFEMLGFFSFIIICSHRWMNNIDQKMIAHGPLSYLLPKPFFTMASFYNFYSYKFIFFTLFYLFIFYPLVLFFLNEVKIKNKMSQKINLRYLSIYFFIIPSFFSLLSLSLFLNDHSKLPSDSLDKSLKCLYSQCKKVF